MGFDPSIILIQRGGILMPIRNLPESLSQAMLVGTMLVGRLGVPVGPQVPLKPAPTAPSAPAELRAAHVCYIYIYIYIRVHIYIHMYVYVYTYIYIYI